MNPVSQTLVCRPSITAFGLKVENLIYSIIIGCKLFWIQKNLESSYTKLGLLEKTSEADILSRTVVSIKIIWLYIAI